MSNTIQIRSVFSAILKMNQTFTAIDLFAGCGGLSCGFEQAGWSVFQAYEANSNAAMLYNLNLKGHCATEKLSINTIFPKCDLILAGPPCQPFSVAGNQRAEFDDRDCVPIFLQAIRTSKPRFAVMENVANLKLGHAGYIDRIVSEIEQLGYKVSQQILNANEFGVPQNRKRFFLIAHHGEFNFHLLKKAPLPVPTVLDTLGSKSFSNKTAELYPELLLTSSMDEYIKRYELKSKCINSRDLHPNKPARTLTCRNLCGGTSDMIRIKLSNGQRRQLTVEEAALLFGFPQNYIFPEDMSRAVLMKCIGNSVPPPLAKTLGVALLSLMSQGLREEEDLIFN